MHICTPCSSSRGSLTVVYIKYDKYRGGSVQYEFELDRKKWCLKKKTEVALSSTKPKNGNNFPIVRSRLFVRRPRFKSIRFSKLSTNAYSLTTTKFQIPAARVPSESSERESQKTKRRSNLRCPKTKGTFSELAVITDSTTAERNFPRTFTRRGTPRGPDPTRCVRYLKQMAGDPPRTDW